MGLMSAVAALVYAARLNAATPKAGVNFELDAIAACFVGGASVTGAVRRGNVWGTQFHPEKSGDAGLRLLKAFGEL